MGRRKKFNALECCRSTLKFILHAPGTFNRDIAAMAKFAAAGSELTAIVEAFGNIFAMFQTVPLPYMTIQRHDPMGGWPAEQ